MTGAKKTHWFRTTLIVLVICGILGTILAAFLFKNGSGKTYAYASILFSFNGAAKGNAPNGSPLDVSDLTSDEILNAALEASGLSGTYNAEQVRDNLSVTGVFPDNIVEQMTRYVSILDSNASKQAPLTDYHATEFTVVLYHELDPNLSSNQLKTLLQNIMAAYRDHFARTNAMKLDPSTDMLARITDFDYPLQLQAISNSNARLSRYAQEMADLAPEFQVKGKGFADIVVRFRNLDSDVDSVSAAVTMNAVSRDPARLKSRYEMDLAMLNSRLDIETEELSLLASLMNGYTRESAIYVVSSSSTLNKIESESTGIYDAIVRRHTEVTKELADTDRNVALTQAKLQYLSGDEIPTAPAETDVAEGEQPAVSAKAEKTVPLNDEIEKRIGDLLARREEAVNEFIQLLDAYSAKQISKKTVTVSAVEYKTPNLLSGSFLVKVVRTAGPFCAVGLMVCLVLLLRSRRKEEKAR